MVEPEVARASNNLDRLRHSDFRNNMRSLILIRDGTFHYFIIFTILVPLTHDSVSRRENDLGGSLC
jgi:hypothetical protein